MNQALHSKVVDILKDKTATPGAHTVKEAATKMEIQIAITMQVIILYVSTLLQLMLMLLIT